MPEWVARLIWLLIGLSGGGFFGFCFGAILKGSQQADDCAKCYAEQAQAGVRRDVAGWSRRNR